MIERVQYLKEVKTVIGKPLIKVLLGMRRVGKSTLMRQIQQMLRDEGISQERIIYLNFELMQFESLKDYKALFDFLQTSMKDNEKYYIFLDEIQEVDNFEKVINSINAEGRAELFITGSNSKLLSGELATYLTGRYYSIEVFPLSFKEIWGAESDKDKESVFIDYLLYGGMPARFDFESMESAKNYLSDMYRSILLKDIVTRYAIRDIELLERFLTYVLHNIGQIFQPILSRIF